MRYFTKSLLLLSCLYLTTNIFCQVSPIAVTGFNQDVVAETGTSSLTTTTSALDGVAVSNKVIYSLAFRTTNGFGGGGIPDNGVITTGTDSYQLASYSGNNALVLPRNFSGDLVLATPAKFNSLRVLVFSTEGTSLINATLFFTDGTSTAALTNTTMSDWFNGTTNLVLSGMGRCTRATPASGADGYPTNPRMYYINIPVSCANTQKLLQKITFTNVTTAGSNAPFPNAVFMALSGAANTQAVTAAVTDATCATGGTATLTPTNVPTPFTVSWNTVPVQTGLTATNLSAGTYQATVTAFGGCTTVVPVTVTLTNNLTMAVHADTTICPGASFSANTVSNAATYSWSPTTAVSNASIANPTLSPTVTTTYTVTGTTGSCTISKTFTVTVAQAVNLTVNADTSICSGSSFTSRNTSNGSSFTWTPTTGLTSSTILNPVLSPISTTQYSITARLSTCSLTKSFTVTVLPTPTVDAGPGSTIFQGSPYQLQGSGSLGTYVWTPATGLSATNILSPLATPLTSTMYTLNITNSQGCSNKDSVLVTVVPYCVKPMNAFTPNGDGFYDKWFITDGNCLIRATVQIYNRYGSKVYESSDYKNDWNGTFKGNPLPDGTYYYNISYLLLNNTTVVKKGSVSILR